MKPAALTTLLLVATALSGCVGQQRYRFITNQPECFDSGGDPFPAGSREGRWPSLDCGDSFFKAGFIEFDESGHALDEDQLTKVLKLIESEKQRTPGGKVITLLYVHGWKNNAAQVNPGAKAKDVEKFKAALWELGYRSHQTSPDKPVPVVGVYVGWRGKSLMGPGWFTFMSYWPRRNTANRVGGGPDLASSINRVIDTTNGTTSADASRVLLVGHSFGARVLEHAIETDRIPLYTQALRRGTPVNPRVDLALYVNAANDSRLSVKRVGVFEQAGLEVRHPDYDPARCAKEPALVECRDYPLLVAITSRGDLATKTLQPIANTLSQDGGVVDPTVAPCQLQAGGQCEYLDATPGVKGIRRTAPAHSVFMQSHLVDEIICRPSTRLDCPASDRRCFSFRIEGESASCYRGTSRTRVGNDRRPFNETAYWIMDVDPRIVKDHGDIWNQNFVSMLGALMAPRGFFDPDAGRMTLRVR